MKKIWKIISVLIALTILVSGAIPAQTVHAAKKLNRIDKNRYTGILESIAENGIVPLGYESEELFGPEFALYDINNDNRKELIITGGTGIRTNAHTIIIAYHGAVKLMGFPISVSPKGIEINDTSYEGAGERYFQYVTTYTLNPLGTKSLKATPRITRHMLWGYEGDYLKGTLKRKYLKKNYYKNNKVLKIDDTGDNILKGTSKISKKAYQKIRSKYKLKKIKMYPVNSSNIKKYVK